MKGNSGHTVTRLLHGWRGGDDGVRDKLMPLVYGEMQKLAQRELRRERIGHTLQSCDLVHEAYERLVDVDIPWNDRAHFYAVAARTMRRVLVDHARAKQSKKRGAGATMLSLDHAYPALEAAAVEKPRDFDVLLVDEALTRLGRIDERMEKVVELHFFGGMTHDEAAEVTGTSRATAQRDLRFAKAWLRKHLEG